MGCLTVCIQAKRRAMSVAVKVAQTAYTCFSRLFGCKVEWSVAPCASVEYRAVKSPCSVSIGLMCSVGVGRWEFLACSDLGFIRTLDKGFILVRKQ